jgi:homospermidine synthase
MTNSTVHTRIDGALVMIGFGSIGRGTLPLIERHIGFDRSRFTVIEPSADFAHILRDHGIRHLQLALTPDNLAEVLTSLFPEGRGMIVNLSVDVDSIEVMKLAQEIGVQYIDTVVEPWPGFYFGSPLPNADRTNYPLRERVRELGKAYVGGPTAVSCCGANPGMVSWLLKEALLRLAADTGVKADPKSREDWADLMQGLGVKGIHVAERHT